MKIENILKPNTFSNLCYLVESSGLKLNKTLSLPFCAKWDVIGHEKIYSIDVTIQDVETKLSKASVFYNEP